MKKSQEKNEAMKKSQERKETASLSIAPEKHSQDSNGSSSATTSKSKKGSRKDNLAKRNSVLRPGQRPEEASNNEALRSLNTST